MKLESLNIVSDLYVQSFWESEEGETAKSYMIERGFTENTLRSFKVGYAPSSWQFELDAEVLEDLIGLRHISTRNNTIRDRFSGRVVFPVCDEQGNVRGFSGRIFGEKTGAKYENSSTSDTFTKGQSLFGMNLARKSIYEKNLVVVVEGFTDAMAFHQVGRENVVATMGTKFTERHILMLSRYTNNLYFGFDADSGGKGARDKALIMTKSLNLNAAIINFPDGKDPADILLQKPMLKA